jgi:hypothetical protein
VAQGILPLAFVLPIIMLMDCPNWNSFAQTRPISPRELWLGKWLFLGLVVLTPLVMQEALHLWLSNQPREVIIAGVWDRLSLVIPTAILVSGITGSTRSPKEFGVAFFVLYGAVIVGVGVAVLGCLALAQILGEPVVSDPTPDALAIRVILCFAAAAFAIIAWLNTSETISKWTRWALIALVGASLPFVNLISPRLPDVQGMEQSVVTANAQAITPSYPLGTVLINRFERTGNPVPGFAVTLRPELESLPENWIIRWQPKFSVFTPKEGVPLEHDNRRGPVRAFEWMNGALTSEDLLQISRLLKPGTMLQQSHGGFSPGTLAGGPFFPGAITDPASEGTVRIDSEAYVFQWKPAATLDVRLQASTEDEIGSWHIAGLHHTESVMKVVVKREQPFLELTSKQHQRDDRSWPRGRYAIVLYDAAAGVARLQENSIWANRNVGEHTGYQRRSMILNFNNAENLPFDFSDADKLKLLIFRLDYLGTFDKRLEADIRLRDLTHSYSSDNRMREKLDLPEFQHRLAALEIPASDASRAVIGDYIYQVLRLTELRERSLSSEDPVIAQLASYVPDHLDLFLDGLESTGSRMGSALEMALDFGISEEQKPAVIARLNRNPKLAELLVEHGWHLEARKELLALLDRRTHLPHGALRALAGFNDPRVIQHFTEELSTTSNVYVYDLMMRQPHLRESADRVVHKLWKKRVFLQTPLHNPDEVLKLGLSHGLPEALHVALEEFRLRDPHRDHAGQGAKQ